MDIMEVDRDALISNLPPHYGLIVSYAFFQVEGMDSNHLSMAILQECLGGLNLLFSFSE